ncbi:MAG: DNA repair protein RecO [Bacteroidota bacterium]|nr:DNA repair protein RecO [Bacteroidota bacterium]
MPETGIVKTEAIVLRAIDYSETSRIVNLFTRDLGKVGVMAKGARSSKSRFGSTLESMARIDVVLHVRPGRDLQILSEATHVAHHAGMRAELERVQTGFRLVELVSALLPEGEPNAGVYALLAASLTALDHAPGRIGNIWPFFQLRLATLLGFGPSISRDKVMALTEDHGVLDLRSGSIDATVGDGWIPARAARTTLRAFAVLARAELADVLRMELQPEEEAAVGRLVRAYVQHHVEEAYPTRAARVFAQLEPAAD